jgi:hypothetical protein
MRRRDRREQGAFLCDSTLAKLSVEVNHTLGSPGFDLSLPCAIAIVRAFMSL